MLRLLHILVSLLIAAAAACALAPSSMQFPAIAPGVRIGPTPVGGLMSEPARAAVERTYARPIRVTYGGKTWKLDRTRFGVRASVDAAVSRALQSRARTQVPLEVASSRAAVLAYVEKVAKTIDRPARDARFVGYSDAPQFEPAARGLAVRDGITTQRIQRALASGSTRPVRISTRPVDPARTVANYGPVIVIQRGANSLLLYDGRQLVRSFGVATGQSVYPTPYGLYDIVDMQRDPWWYPPKSDWAKDEKPIPPGPGNPLGTRWMGLNVYGVGIHGTPDDASIGYSASHGCIRMHIYDAEWLFEHVDVGTPVLIL